MLLKRFLLAFSLLIAVDVFISCSATPDEEAQSTVSTVEAGVSATSVSTVDLSWLNTTTTTTVPSTYVAPSPPINRSESEQLVGGTRWDQLAMCECGGNWSCNTGNGFGGGLQFMHQNSYSTWLSFGGGEFAAHPWEASREEQIVIAERVLISSGWGAWPGCSRKFGWL